jgi:hypothetical protein
MRVSGFEFLELHFVSYIHGELYDFSFLLFLSYEFCFAFLEFLFASYAAEMVGFAFISDFILSRVFI